MTQVAGNTFTVPQTKCTILCCKCGVSMEPNAVNMCVTCFALEVNIKEGLKKRHVLVHCPECESYLQPPRTWVKLQLESREFLKFCLEMLKKNMKIYKVNLVHAKFIWTEPHSKRVKVNVTIQKEVLNGATAEDSYDVEYIQHDRLCESCSRVQANPDQWVAAVQLRQHVSHRRTFFYLEQLILKHGAAVRAVRIKQMVHGIDFYFSKRSHGVNFLEFIGQVAPVKSRSDKQLVSHDSKSNNYNYKYTFSVEISPICHEDLICLPREAARALGNIGPIVICIKVTNSIALLDPFTLKYGFLNVDQYWRTPFKSLLTCRQLVEYRVFDVEVVSTKVGPSEVTIGGTKYVLADAQVARVSDIGKNDTMFSIRTHLGHLLKAGDLALGYDLYGANCNDIELDKYRGHIPEVILIKKSYEEIRQKRRGKPRSWKLKSLPMEVDDKVRVDDLDHEQFLNDLEENSDLRSNIPLYKNKDYQPSKMASVTDDEELLLEELLALNLSENEDEEDYMEE